MRTSFPLLALAIVLAAAPASAQFLGYGLRGGLNSSHVTFDFLDSDEALDSKGGYQAGAFVEVGLPLSPLSVLIEAEYARRGYEQSIVSDGGPVVGEPSGTATVSTDLHFVSVPVLARVKAPGLGFVTPYLLAGPRLDVLAGSDPGALDFEGEEVEDDFPDFFSTVSLSGVLGAGLGLGAIVGPEVRVEARYGFGLTDLHENENLEMKNRGLDFALVLAF